MMDANESQEWAVVRLATLQKRGEKGKLLFATVTVLAQGRPLPAKMSGVGCHRMRQTDESLYFRRVLLTKEAAISWYRSLGEGERATPIPSRVADRESLDGVPIAVSKLDDVQPWPALGLPIREELFSSPGRTTIEPAPFIGSVPGRLHRRFGDQTGFESFLQNVDAQAFITRRMHINLAHYREYLGGAVYIAPDPVIQQIDYFMVPGKDGAGEKIVYRFVPRLGQSIEGTNVIAFDKEARLLTSFETYPVPADGVLEVEKGTCMGEYGFVVTHETHGVLAYQPSVPFLRQMNLSIRAASSGTRKVSVPLGASKKSPRAEYDAAMGSELASRSVHGEVRNPGGGVRVAKEAHRRERLAEAERYGQRWFEEGSRAEAVQLIREVLRAARTRVIIADPYLGNLQIGQFLYAVHGSEVTVTLLTTDQAFNPTLTETKRALLESFRSGLEDLEKTQKLKPDVKIIPSSSLHDRFLVVDEDVWFLGNSLNSFGEKASMIVRIPNPTEVIEQLEALGSKAPTLEAYIGSLPAVGNQEREE